MNEILSVDSVGRRFGERKVLTAASLRVRSGRVTALLGRNGCGKTTLLRVVTGLIRADHGRITYLGRVQPQPRLHRMAAHGMFFIPERDLLCRGREVDWHFRTLYARYPQQRAAAAAAIERLGIGALLDRPPELLSSGEKRRCELALALARQSVCLLADEPFLGLAPRDAEVVAAAMRQLAATGGGVLVTGHEVELLLAVADDVVWMTAGTTHALGAPQDAVRYEPFRREYLGPRGHVPTPSS